MAHGSDGEWLGRRSALILAAGWWLDAAAEAHAAPPPSGWVKPRSAALAVEMNCSDGRQRSLVEMLRGKSTAVQLMFTGCSTSCPMQGALFAAVAEQGLPESAQLLSISIDALGDNTATLQRWLAQFGRPAAWSAAVPRISEVELLSGALKGITGKPGTHSAQVFYFDRQSRLSYRSGDSPPAREVRGVLGLLAAGAAG